jgi:hypothetical protein
MKKIIFLTATAAILIMAASCGQNAQKQTISDEQSAVSDEENVFDEEGPNPAPPPPDIIVGTWKASINDDIIAAYLEIFPDGMAGLYKGLYDSSDVFEIYHGPVLATSESPNEIVLDMNLYLNWYIYESDDGTPITGVPDSYNGVYTLRHEQKGGKRILHVKAGADADPLFDIKELHMERVSKTLQGGFMEDVQD